VKNEPILVIFGMQNPKEILHQTIVNVSTSPIKCSHCTLRKTDRSQYQNMFTILSLMLDATYFSL